MRRFPLVLAVLAAAAAAWAAPAGATNECRGLQVCVPIAGPWVVVPTASATPRPRVEYQLSCPPGYIVGGLDAELSTRAIDLTFTGSLGSPVNPGITTSRSVVFLGTYVGRGIAAATFRPHIGCMPSSGGGGRHLNSLAVFPPGRPAARRVSFMPLTPGVRELTQSCAAGERLIAATHAVGFFTGSAPTARLISSVRASRSVRHGRVTLTVRSGIAVRDVSAVVQLSLICAGGK